MPTLSDPLPLPCGAVLRNRIAKAAMSEDLASKEGVPGEPLLRLYRRWGESGAGMLLTGHVMVDPQAKSEPKNVVIETGSAREPLRAWAEAGQAGGAAVWVQLNHPGRQVARMMSREPVAPSAVPMQIPGGAFATPRALEEREIERIIARFGESAAVCREVGFAGVQIHGAHGYLVSQFLSPHTNRREDAWGGDPERRARFLIGVTRAIRGAVGPDFPVGVKLNSADFQRGGFTEEESMAVVERLNGEGVDLLEVSGGSYERPAMTGAMEQQKESTRLREAYFLDYARKVRGIARMPLMLTGGLRTRAGMEQALAEGVDVVGMARPFAVEPDIARRILGGEALESALTPKRTGIAMLDGLVEPAWAGWQIARIAAGKEPAPNASPWRALAGLAWNTLSG